MSFEDINTYSRLMGPNGVPVLVYLNDCEDYVVEHEMVILCGLGVHFVDY